MKNIIQIYYYIFYYYSSLNNTIATVFLGAELDSAQSLAEQMLCQTAAFQGRAGQRRFLEAGSRENGRGQTVQTSLRNFAADSQLQEAILILRDNHVDDDDSDGVNDHNGNDDAQCSSEQLFAAHQLSIQHPIRDPA